MKKLTLCLSLILILNFLYSKPGLKHKYTIEEGLSIPESVNFDTARNQCYISNINGKPTATNGKGYISIIDTSGNMIEKKWVKGLNAPKGAAIYEQYLFVSDINRVVKVNIDSAEIVDTYSVPEAKFLNDVAVDKKGNVYISDSKRSAVYCLKNNKIQKWLEKDLINKPNGLYTKDNYLYIGNSGDGWIKKVKLGTKDIEKVAQLGGTIDGLIKIQKGNFIVSNWKGKTEMISPKKQYTLLNTTEEKINSADLEYIESSKHLFIPTFSDNRVIIYKLSNIR